MIHQLQSIDDSRLDIFRDLRGNNQATQQGLFVAEGPTVARRLFASDYDVHSIVLNDAKWNSLQDELPDGVDVYRVSNAMASELVGYSFHAGVLAAGIRGPSPSLEMVCETAVATGEEILLVVADNVIDRQNVGGMIRVASAFGATAVVFGPHCSDPFSRRSLRVSMGNGLYLPICQPSDLQAELLTVANRFDIRLFGTVLDANATPLPEVARPPHRAIMFGNESHGLSEDWLARCDERITIPMQGGTDSLNVAFAAGIFLYEFTRQ
jgi:tRNA G18 (ribose-2'-O)-methylase SpoU